MRFLERFSHFGPFLLFSNVSGFSPDFTVLTVNLLSILGGVLPVSMRSLSTQTGWGCADYKSRHALRVSQKSRSRTTVRVSHARLSCRALWSARHRSAACRDAEHLLGGYCQLNEIPKADRRKIWVLGHIQCARLLRWAISSYGEDHDWPKQYNSAVFVSAE